MHIAVIISRLVALCFAFMLSTSCTLLTQHSAHQQHSLDKIALAPSHITPTTSRNEHDAHHEMMHGMYGSYPMTQESSGTSWVPASSPFPGFYSMRNDWMLMFEGFFYPVYDKQGSCRGDKQFFAENMFMIMGQKDLGCNNTIGFRTMFSLEPLTIGACGYPLLFQTGETCDGRTPLINRQHPHDLFGELAITACHRFDAHRSMFLYVGLPGEPALGPATFIHRYSAYYNPEAPLGHHWMDSTHITFGVITAGFVWHTIKIEGSIFTGREPDQHRFNIEKPRFDSYAIRITSNPTDNLSFQYSYGFLKSPEQLEPCVATHRYTMSAIYNKPIEHGNWQSTAVFGLNNNDPGNILPAILIESTLGYKQHRIFARFEAVDKDELFIEPDPLADQIFTIKKFTGGYVYQWKLPCVDASIGIGGLVSGAAVPSHVRARYGSTASYMIFMEMRLGE